MLGKREKNMPLLVFVSVKSVQKTGKIEMHTILFILLPYFPFFVTLCSNVSSNIKYQADVSSSSKVKIKFTGHILRARSQLSTQPEIYYLFLSIREELLLSYFT